MNLRFLGRLATIGYLLSLSPLWADAGMTADTKTVNPELKAVTIDEPLFTEDRVSVQFNTGALFAPTFVGPTTEHVSYEQSNFRVGWLLNTPSDSEGIASVFRGSWEAIGELSISGVFSGFGNVMGGANAFVRYNFVQPDWRVVPYAQVGVGILGNDLYENKSQNAIGQGLEFVEQGAIGLRFLVDKNWTIDLEGQYEHISNADTSYRNTGLNAIGGSVGFSYYFDNLWK
jgi:lipid A 3-O-deacylase